MSRELTDDGATWCQRALSKVVKLGERLIYSLEANTLWRERVSKGELSCCVGRGKAVGKVVFS